MKRVVFAFALMFLLIFFNSFCLYAVAETKENSVEKLDLIYQALSSGNYSKTASECEKFANFWNSKHHFLSLIVRHELLDQITMSVSQFGPLSEFGEAGKLASEIKRCRNLIEEIWDSERPLLRNIF